MYENQPGGLIVKMKMEDIQIRDRIYDNGCNLITIGKWINSFYQDQ